MNVTLTMDVARIHALVVEKVTKEGFIFVDALLQCASSDSDYYLSAKCNLRTPQGDDVTASVTNGDIRKIIFEHLTAIGYGFLDYEVSPNSPMIDGEPTDSFVVHVSGITIDNSAAPNT
ncbi:MAG: hypothetical protein Q8T09_08195 [Candidatus Melainabacteria bacterium]|nr:hypothetical protein [Candidatus Melainabacteria bacterium]